MSRAFKPYTIGSTNRSPHQGEIWLADSLPFDGGTGSKSRPVLIKRREDDRFECYKCTSQPSAFRNRYRIMDPEEAGLDKESYIDYDPVFVQRGQLVYRIGMMSEEDIAGFGRL